MKEDIRDGHGAASGSAPDSAPDSVSDAATGAATEAPADTPPEALTVAGGAALAVNEDPMQGSTRGAAATVLSAPAEPSAPPTADDVRRFRRAALRARLALLGVAFDPATDEATLRRMLRAAEGQGSGAEALPASPVPPVSTAPADAAGSGCTAAGNGQAGQVEPAELAKPAERAAPPAPPSAEMRRATARHLRERQRAAAEDAGSNAGRPRGRGRS